MNDNRPTRLYLAGPMSGLPDSNYPAFHHAADQLRDMGYLVENPAECNLPANSSWHDFMRSGVRQLIKCDAIVLMPGWIHSRGAKAEFQLALNLDMRAFELDHILKKGRVAA